MEKSKKISDFGSEYELVSRDIDVKEILEMLGHPGDEYDGLFLKMSNGEYEEVYGFHGIPLKNNYAYLVKPIKHRKIKRK